jgi:hypothetical protein
MVDLILKQQFPIIAAVNQDDVLSKNLLSSPDVVTGNAVVHAQRGFRSAGAAYNAGLDSVGRAPVVALVHQDVYLPAGWVRRVQGQLGELDRDWAVAGVWGIGMDGAFIGRVWCSGGGQEHIGGPVTAEAASVDEIVILLNTDHGLRFDSHLPGFHLYATDLICQARSRGLKAFGIPAPVVHNSRCNHNVYDRGYRAAYRFMQRKWRQSLPLLTCVAPVTRSGHWEIRRRWLKAELRKALGRASYHSRPGDPRDLAIGLGYESAGGVTPADPVVSVR